MPHPSTARRQLALAAALSLATVAATAIATTAQAHSGTDSVAQQNATLPVQPTGPNEGTGGSISGVPLTSTPETSQIPAITVTSAPETTPVPAGGQVLWSPDIAAGPSTWSQVQCPSPDPGTLSVANDAAKGKVWQAYQPAGEERCEVVGPTLNQGSTYYVGWSSKYTIDDSQDRYIFQLKCSPSTGTANHPLDLNASDGSIKLENWDYNHNEHTVWTAPVHNGEWHSYALKVTEDRTGGTIDFWFDGVKQNLTAANGATVSTLTGVTTYDGTTDYLKWGSYHPSPGDATNEFTSPKLATTLDAATAGS